MDLDYLKGKSVLVTGGTGTVGSFCVRQLLEKSEARRVIIFSRDEFKQNNLSIELEEYKERVRFFLGDVRDRDRLNRAFHGVDYVIHTAALKHVHILEYNPFEAVQTNIIGTQNVVDAAVDQGVKKLLLISTDKSANPTSLYGATKLCAEKLVVGGNYYGSPATKFSAIRFGNIFGSRGSFVELIKEQRKTGVVKLTHEEMSRFWITASQATAFIMESLGSMHGGEIFVPKIPSMTVKNFITTCAPDSDICVTGIRPGEKIHEILLTPEEARHSLEFDDKFIILPENDGLLDKFLHLEGSNLDHNFIYASDKNEDWISPEKLLELLEEI
ncbi:MAG: SDR family NAD(P)-dependent oxidoreductase [bacterium]|nr:SDR family NAD(P)-dependent oxidoreductase [bacterium]